MRDGVACGLNPLAISQAARLISHANTGKAAMAAGAESWSYAPNSTAVDVPDSGYDLALEFEWGLDLILDGLERRRGG